MVNHPLGTLSEYTLQNLFILKIHQSLDPATISSDNPLVHVSRLRRNGEVCNGFEECVCNKKLLFTGPDNFISDNVHDMSERRHRPLHRHRQCALGDLPHKWSWDLVIAKVLCYFSCIEFAKMDESQAWCLHIMRMVLLEKEARLSRVDRTL